MASSGTYTFAPDIADLIDDAFERCGLDPTTLTGRHMRGARRALDLMFAEWGNRHVRLWAVDEQTQVLTASTASYTPASGTEAILEMFIRRDGIDTPVTAMMRDEYANIPSKSATGMPSMYWYDRGANTYYLWQSPENSTDVIHYYRVRRLQDTGGSAYTPDVPYLWTEALVAGLAPRLAAKYAPDCEDKLAIKAERAFTLAKGEDRERASTRIRMRLRR